MRKVMSLDPSGNFSSKEGKGTTGWVKAEVTDDGFKIVAFGDIKATNFEKKLNYWRYHIFLLEGGHLDQIVCEDYRLYNHHGARAAMQSYSLMETPRLLGILEYICHRREIPFTFQMANQMKPWSEERLVKMGILEKKGNKYYLNGKQTNDHIRSALKHFMVWYSKEEK